MLGGKPLIQYSIDIAKMLFSDDDICVSTDSEEIKDVVESNGLKVPFMRPNSLAADTSGMSEVVTHAIRHFENLGRYYKHVLLLQPTSPFRTLTQLQDILSCRESNPGMIVGVTETNANPYYVLFEEDKAGFLQKSKQANFVRRQDCPVVWQINGSLYLIDVQKLKQEGAMGLLMKKKFIMDELSLVDIDSPLDWMFAEYLIEKGFVKN